MSDKIRARWDAAQGRWMRMGMSQAHEAAGVGRRAIGWTTRAYGPNLAAEHDAPRMRNRSRDATRNNIWAEQGITRRASEIVGSGIKPQSRARDPEAREAIQELWDESSDEMDADGHLDFYGLQNLAQREMDEGGECFARFRQRRPGDGLLVPMQLQLIEAEQCPPDYYAIARNGNRIRAGVEFDSIGRRVAYWMYGAHPRDIQMTAGDLQLRRVPADEILHIYEPVRAGQVRGLPLLSQALVRLNELHQYEDAELVRKKFASMITGSIENPEEGSGPGDPFSSEEVDGDGKGVIRWEPGQLLECGPGQKVNFKDSPDVGTTYEPFLRSQIMAAAASMDLSYELLTHDMRGLNDRTLRVLLNTVRRRLRQVQQHVQIKQLCRPVWRRWMGMAVASGALDLPGFSEDRMRYQAVRWVPEGWAYINPVQDVQADREAVRAGFKSRAEVVSQKGRDVEQVDREQQQDQERADSHGLMLDVDGRRTSRAGVTQARPEGTEFPGVDDDGEDEDEGADTDAGTAKNA